MKLKKYLSGLDLPAKNKLAGYAGICPQYLYQISIELRKPGAKTARLISKHTKGAVSLHELRPDIWAKE